MATRKSPLRRLIARLLVCSSVTDSFALAQIQASAGWDGVAPDTRTAALPGGFQLPTPAAAVPASAAATAQAAPAARDRTRREVAASSVSPRTGPAASGAGDTACAENLTQRRAPLVSLAETLLWPPNHPLVDVGLGVDVTAPCEGRVTTRVAVFADEPDEDQTGDGNVPGDARLDGTTLFIRSERKGDADGRVYLILTTSTLPDGISGSACVTAVVPKSQKKADIASVRAQASAAQAYCGANQAPPPSYFKLTEGVLTLANVPPVVNAGPDQAVDFPGPATLQGTATDDGRPNGTLAVSWSKVDGPAGGIVTFGSPGTAETTANFGAAGTYTLRLTANDGQLTASDDVVVDVSLANEAPQVDAGPDRDITLPETTVSLAGSATDDGRPAGSQLTPTWSVASPAGAAVTFTDVHAAETTATLPGVGEFVLRLTADDGQFAVSDDVRVTVHAQPPPVLSIADTAVPEGHEGITAAVVSLALSYTWPQSVTVDYLTADGTAVAGCDYRTAFGTVTFAPGETTAELLVPIAGELAPEEDETLRIRIGNVNQATLERTEATLTVLDDDAANTRPSALSSRAPADRANGVELPPTLAWSAADPDAGDVLTHDVHLGPSFATSGQSWARTCPANQGPGPRTAPVTGYDEASDRLILFGGMGSADESLWILDNASAAGGPSQWTAIPTTGGPVGLGRAASAYDAATNRLFIVGGCSGDCAESSEETWVLANANGLGGTPTWSLLAGAGPGPRVDHAAAIDPATRRLIVFGGSHAGAALADVWLLNLDGPPAWQAQPAGGAGPALSGMTASYDVERNVLVVFGGRVGAQAFNDTWVLSNANGSGGSPQWSRLAPAGTAPPARWGHTAAYDSVTARLVVYGGSTASANPARRFVFRDIWMLTDAAGAGAPEWIRLSPNEGPTGQVQAAGAFSASANRLVVLGGTSTSEAIDEIWVLADAMGTLPLVTSDAATSFTTDGLVPGALYYWRIVTRDDHGAAHGSPAWRFTSNAPPTVDAGPDQEIRLPISGVSLAGTASDDGLPAGSVLAVRWSAASGPGPVAFASPDALATTASFTAAGTYVLALTASDGMLPASDSLTVTVRADNEPPVANAGPDQTVVLPGGSTEAPPFIQLVRIQTGFSSPVGIDYHQPTNQIVMSVNYPFGGPYNFEMVAADGSRQKFSNVSGVTGELKVATVPDEGGGRNRGGFAAGTLFSGTDTGGQILRVSPDGTAVDRPWITLPGETGLMRGSLHLDRTGVFGGDLIVVTTAGGVWRIKANGAATRLASIGLHLEGVITIPDDPLRYGPWAGKILIGAETLARLYTVDPQGAVAFYELGIPPEDIEIVPADQNFFGVDFNGGTLWGIPAASFTGMVGDILIAQEHPGILWWVRWNGARFESSKVAQVIQWEHVTFAPAGLSPLPSTSGTAKLHGTATDDGLPIGQLTTSWEKVAGPGLVSFTQPAQLATAATFSQPGEYTLRLTASDSVLAASDLTKVTLAGNLAPVVSAGPDQSISTPAPVHLLGTAVDDGLPSGTLSTFWTKVLGPGTASFSAPTYDPAADLSTIVNPSGPWTFGYTPAGGLFTPFAIAGATSGLPGWFRADPQSTTSPGYYPFVVANPSGDVVPMGGNKLVPGSTLVIAPGPAGQRGVVRWTAPAAGSYLVQGVFQGGTSTTSSDVALVVDGSDVLRRNLGAAPDAAPFSFVRTLAAGDVIELSVGYGANARLDADETFLTLRVAAAGPAATQATFSVPGTYLLRLLASDGGRTGFDDAVITIAPTACTAIPTRPAGWWPGEGDPDDLGGGQPGVALGGLGFAPGKVGQAFAFDGVDDAVVVAASPQLNVSSITIEGWVKLATVSRLEPLVEYSSPNRLAGVLLWHSAAPDFFFISPGALSANLRDSNGVNHVMTSAPGVLKVGQWTHVALTYDAAAGRALLYVNGAAVASAHVGSFAIQTALNLNLGHRPGDTVDTRPRAFHFTGGLDEMAVFGRALSADEIRAIANAGAFGKCPDVNQPPVVSAGPDRIATLRCDGAAIATLQGAVTDDGLPEGAALTMTWSSLGGPGAVTFSTPSAATTEATFPAVGDYTLRLVGSDSALAAQDVAAVHVSAFLPPTGSFVASGILPSQNGQNGPAPVTVSGLTAGRTYSLYLWGSWLSGPFEVTNGTVPTTLVSGFGNPTILLTSSVSPFTPRAPMVVRRFEATATAVTMAIQDIFGSYFNNAGHLFFQIYEGVPGEPLVVDAGPDQTLTQPVGSATLTASVSDIGRPPVATSTLQWTQVSGPPAVIASPASATTSVTLSQKGTYVFRFQATSCVRSVQDAVTIMVVDRPDLSATSVDASGLTVDGQTLAAGGTISAQVANGGGAARAFEVTFFEDRNGNGVLDPAADGLLGAASVASLDAAQTATAAAAVAGDVLFAGSPVHALVDSGGGIAESDESNNYAQSGSELAQPDLTASYVRTGESAGSLVLTARIGNGGGSTVPASVPVSFYDRNPATVGTRIATVATSTSLAPGRFVDVSVTVPAATLARPLWVVADDQGGLVGTIDEHDEINNVYDSRLFLSPTANTAPTVDAGPDQRLVHPQRTAVLDGATTDDGLPLGELTMQWGVAQRPEGATVTFTDSSAADTTATFSAAGTYVLRLTADDGQTTGSDDVTVVVELPNQAPSVDAGPDQTITKPTTSVQGSISDDGLPHGSVVTSQWSKTEGPGSVAFGDAGTLGTTVTFGQPGHYVLGLTASDSALSTTDMLALDVTFVNSAPVVNAGPDQQLTLPANTATLAGNASDDGLPVSSTLTFKWTAVAAPGVVSFGSPTALQTTATLSDPGPYTLRLTASDGASQTSDDLNVFVAAAPATGSAPAVALAAPLDGARLTTLTDVAGTVQSDALASWKLEYRLEGDTTYTRFATGATPITSASLGTFDPTMLLNGIYEVRLTGTDTAGRSAQTSVKVVVRENQKIGPFILSFLDLEVPVVGLPIQVTRTYDSRDKGQGDFGVGWRLDLSNVHLAEKEVTGLVFEGVVSDGFFPSYCLQPVRPQVVTVTTPDGEVYEFQPVMSPACRQFAPIDSATVRFRPLPGTNATLAPAGDGFVFVSGSWPGAMQLFDGRRFEIYDPEDYVLTLRDGRQLSINQRRGLTQIRDLNGNVLSVSSGGITHSGGVGVAFTRDSQGRITRITDPAGHRLTYQYDPAGDLVSVTDQEERTTRFIYLPNHLLHKIIEPDGQEIVAAEYDDDGRLIRTCRSGKCRNRRQDLAGNNETWTDPTGHETVMTYDAAGHVTSVTQVGRTSSRTTRLEYNALGLVTQRIDPDGAKTLFTYDGRGNRTAITTPVPEGGDPADYTTTLTYNSQDLPTSVRYPSGLAYTATYDAAGNITSIRDDEGRLVEARTYRSDGALLAEEDAFGRFEYGGLDSRGIPQTVTDPAGDVLAGQYDANGNLIRLSVNGGPPSLFSHDGLGRPSSAQYPSGITVTYGYNDGTERWSEIDSLATGRIRWLTDESDRLRGIEANGRVQTHYQHDAAGRLVTQRGPLGRETRYSYDDFGQVEKIVAPNGGETRFVRDPAGRILELTDALGEKVAFTYRADGNVSSFTDARDQVWRYEYTVSSATTVDPLQRSTTTHFTKTGDPWRTILPDGSERKVQYLRDVPLGEEGSYIEKIVDEGGHERKYGYAGSGEMTSATDLAGAVYGFAADETRLTVSAPNGETVTLESGAGFTSIAYGDGGVTRFDQDAKGQTTRKTMPSGAFLELGYDGLGRRVSSTDSATGEVSSYMWNDADQLEQTTGSSGVTTYAHGPLGGLTRLVGTEGAEVSYGRDLLGRTTRVELRPAPTAPARAITYRYDPTGNLTEVVDPVAGATRFEHDAANRLTRRTFPNGITSEYGYDLRDRITSLVHRSPAGTVLASFEYQRGGSGEPLRVTREDGSSVAYDYDAALRLTRESYFDVGGGLVHETVYSYDAAGNRLTRAGAAGTATYTYQPGFRLQTVTSPSGVESYSHDAHGGLASIQRDGRSFTLGYSTDGQLTAVREASAGSLISYGYDPMGRRVRASDGTGERRFLVAPALGDGLDALQMITDGAGSLTTGYIFAGPEVLMRYGNGGETFYLTDAMGSVVALADMTGTVTARFEYGAFGDLRSASGAAQPPAGAGGDFRFHGGWLEEGTGFYHFGQRVYDHRTGRFLTRDPLGPVLDQPESVHPYHYANGNPQLYRDPTGLFSILSVNVSLNVQSIVSSSRTIALDAVRQQVREELMEFAGKVVLKAITGYLPIDIVDTAKFVLDAGEEVLGDDAPFFAKVEQGVMKGVCYILNDSPWIAFEPGIDGTDGEIKSDGYGCPADEKRNVGKRAGHRYPDFYITQSGKPTDNESGIVLGEIKASIRTFYHTWLVRKAASHFRPQQFEAFAKHTSTRIKPRLMVLVAFNNGTKIMIETLKEAMIGNGVAGFIIALR